LREDLGEFEDPHSGEERDKNHSQLDMAKARGREVPISDAHRAANSLTPGEVLLMTGFQFL
jgi:hypothetical protein